jgi:ABC-type transporter Mla subunit MlaD
MEERDWLKRIDANLARGNELFDRLDEELRLSRLSRERSDAASESLFDAFNRLVRDVLDRLERMQDQHAGALEGFQAALSSWERKLDESMAETKAQRGALIAILDRLGPNGSTAAA